MRFQYIGSSILLVFILIAGSALAQDLVAGTSDAMTNNTTANNTNNTTAANLTVATVLPMNGTSANVTANETAPVVAPDNATASAANGTAESPAVANATVEAAPVVPATAAPATAAPTTTAPNLQYIWTVTGIEVEPITMMLKQEGSTLFGAAKYEPAGGPNWNAAVSGTMSGSNVNLVMTKEGGDGASYTLSGVFESEALSGTYFKLVGGNKAASGNFSAIWINPSVEEYTPATVAEVSQAATPTTTTAPATETQPTAQTIGTPEPGNQTEGPVQLGGKREFVDVRKYKDQIGPGGDLSGIPPGMGGVL